MQTPQQMREHKERMLKHPTHFEAAFAKKLKKTGVRFSKQAIIGFYIVDFAVPSKMLIIEIDGEVHETQKEYDRKRDEFLSKWFTVVRVKNADVDGLDVEDFIASFPDAAFLNDRGKNAWFSALAKAGNKKFREPLVRTQKLQLQAASRSDQFRGMSKKKIKRILKGTGGLKTKMRHLTPDEINRCYSQPVVDPSVVGKNARPLLPNREAAR